MRLRGGHACKGPETQSAGARELGDGGRHSVGGQMAPTGLRAEQGGALGATLRLYSEDTERLLAVSRQGHGQRRRSVGLLPAVRVGRGEGAGGPRWRLS